jgi:hypothetical protein
MDGYTAAETKTVTIETGEVLTYREVGKQDSAVAAFPWLP